MYNNLTKETATDSSIMLPTTDGVNAAFVADNSLEHERKEEDVLNANGKGNNEFESNMSEDIDDTDNVGNVDNVEILDVEQAGEEVNDNLNEYSSALALDNAADTDIDREQDYNEELLDGGNNAENNEDDIEVFNESAKERERERENVYSSDEEDEEATTTEMHPTFNDEWGSLNEGVEDVVSNAIDVEDDEKYIGKPYDLSHDIDVNNVENLPINPDAVFIDGYNPYKPTSSMPRFEKLSLNNSPPTK